MPTEHFCEVYLFYRLAFQNNRLFGSLVNFTDETALALHKLALSLPLIYDVVLPIDLAVDRCQQFAFWLLRKI